MQKEIEKHENRASITYLLIVSHVRNRNSTPQRKKKFL